ncbi:MAG: ABC transporter substrate-binding protein [Leptolyngbyaceae cyanobacterium MO_188.B28]|nr:ABC transporter substrate-binding protein [Leptolyngbyaceae cyanobacterium MO_188.B28]
MDDQRLGRGLALILGGVIVACSGATSQKSSFPNSTASVETDSVEQSIDSASRIVALTSLTADIVQRLDARKLVGVPGSALLRQDSRFEGLTVVSEGRTPPNLEQIVALEPDLVIGAEGFHDQALQRLTELEVPTLTIEVNSWGDLQTLTQTLADAVNADPDPLLGRFQACFNQASENSLSALVLVSREPLLSPNKQSWAGDFLRQFNFQNLTAELQGQSPFEGYITLSAEKVLESNPEILILVDTGEGLIEQIQADPFWKQLKATQMDRVHVFDYYGLVNPGSIASIEQTCAKLSQISELK